MTQAVVPPDVRLLASPDCAGRRTPAMGAALSVPRDGGHANDTPWALSVMPAGPAPTSARKTRSRASWARAARAACDGQRLRCGEGTRTASGRRACRSAEGDPAGFAYSRVRNASRCIAPDFRTVVPFPDGTARSNALATAAASMGL